MISRTDLAAFFALAVFIAAVLFISAGLPAWPTIDGL